MKLISLTSSPDSDYVVSPHLDGSSMNKLYNPNSSGAPCRQSSRNGRRLRSWFRDISLFALVAVVLGSGALSQIVGCVPNTADYPCVYVANQGNGNPTFSVINGTTNAVIDTISNIAPNAPTALAMTPNNASVYFVLPSFSNTGGGVGVIDTATNAILLGATGAPFIVQLQGTPSQIAITPDGTHAWVAETPCDCTLSFTGIEIINTTNPPAISAPPITQFGTVKLMDPTAVAFTPDGTTAYMADLCPNPAVTGQFIACVDKVDIATRTVLSQTVITGTFSSAESFPLASIAVSPDGSQVALSVETTNSTYAVAFINTATNAITVVATNQSDPLPTGYGFGVIPSGTLYAAQPGAFEVPTNQVNLFQNLSGGSGTGTITVGNGPAGVGVSADGASVYVTNSGSASVSVINPALGVVATPTVGNNPQGVAAMPSIPVAITTQPASQTIDYGQTDTLSVVATGTAPIAYQWYQEINGVQFPIQGATNSSYTTPPLTANMSYGVTVSNLVSGGNINSTTATITVNSFVAPVITTQPASQAIIAGQTATLSVVATGTSPLAYQWYQGQSGNTSTPIAGATGSSFTTPVLTTTTSYWVLVSSLAATASTQSNTATITVTPAITTQPASQTIPAGQVATMSVVAIGTPPITYQWYQGQSGNTSSPIAAATNSSYTTPPLGTTTSYWVLVGSAAGTVNSATATITVNQLPTCTLAVQGPGTNMADFSTMFSVQAVTKCTDPQGLPFETISIDWGDGSSSPVGGSMTAHTYASAGTYAIAVTATDTAGLQGSTPASLTLVPTSTSPGVFAGQSSNSIINLAYTGPNPPVTVSFECTTVIEPDGTMEQASDVGISCSSTPAVVTLYSIAQRPPQPVTIGISTTGAALGRSVPVGQHENWFYALCLPLPGLLFLGAGAAGSRRRSPLAKYTKLAMIAAILLPLASCGGGFKLPPTTPKTTTSPISYQVTVVDMPVPPTNPNGFVQTSLIVPLTVSQPQ